MLVEIGMDMGIVGIGGFELGKVSCLFLIIVWFCLIRSTMQFINWTG